jgi:hypothetical protein
MTITSQIQTHISRRENYVLLQRFRMPIEGGSSRDAIAVTVEVSKILLSFYTLMVHMIILHLWYFFVLFAIAFAYRGKGLTRNKGAANVAIWNSQASPLSIIKAMFDYRAHIPKYAALWASAAFLAWAGAFVMSLLVSPQLIIGAAAPANLPEIYIPTGPKNNQSSSYLRYLSVTAPGHLRAIEALGAVDPKTGAQANLTSFNVTIQDPKTWKDGDNDMYQLDYAYEITGVDFGLQHLPDLVFSVQGSCRTEYSWYDNETSHFIDDTEKIWVDHYKIFNTTSANVSRSSHGDRPTTVVFVPEKQSGANLTFAFLISSAELRSFTEGTDPWYLTESIENDPEGAAYWVQVGRPPLSCWEQSLMSFKGVPKTPINDIEDLDKLRPYPGLVAVFKDALSFPRITRMAQTLGYFALKSAQTSQGLYFDAGTASIRNDLQRLILGSYVFTKNIFLESTLFDKRYDQTIPNLAYNQTTRQFKDGVADFVIYGSGFAALSVKVLIIIPVITAFLWVTVNMLTDNPFKPLPWAYVNALKAPVLYSAVDIETFKADSSHGWKRKSTTPHYQDKDAPSHVRPTFERGAFSWSRSGDIPHFRPEDADRLEETDRPGEKQADVQSSEV